MSFNPQPKPTRWHSAKYEKWLKSLPCIALLPGCTGEAVPHHIKGIGHLSGCALKAPSWAAIPLCPSCHNMVQGYKEYFELQFEWALKIVGRAIDEGVLIFVA